MKAVLSPRITQYLILASKTKGFTLIELLIVTIIVGILAAVSLPSFLGQIGKAREAEAKTHLGTISRGQQAYHFENRAFYNGTALENFVGFTSETTHYSFTGDSNADANKALHTAYATEPSISQARDFAAGIYYNASNYSQTICVATAVDNDEKSSSVTAQTDGSCNGGRPIK